MLRLILLLLSVSQILIGQNITSSLIENNPIQREFRAAWIATVANINWPSKPGLSEEKQKEEAIELLDLLKRCNYNAAIFQVRPQADAIYKSDLEPWSYFLTGKQGTAPDDFYDPLEFWIEEAHKRCIELHAWINPYRAHHKDGKEISEYSVVNTKPELVVKLKEGYWWFDPAIEETQDHLFIVVMDIARRYDIDGIHFDDYFYPYPSYNEELEFPDSMSWYQYRNSGGNLSRKNWRRDNVNKFIERIYSGLKLMKPHVKFGLSPFGIWRPNNPPSIKGFDQYDKLYADAKLWLNKGWIDYFSPQLYWTINDIDQSFPVLLSWWQNQNYKGRHLWPGSNISRGSDEAINQIMIIRGIVNKSPGNIHWSIAPLVNDALLSTELIKGPYNKPALIPSSPWLWNKPPVNQPMKIEYVNDEVVVKHNISKIKKFNKWIIYYRYSDEWNYIILPSSEVSFGVKMFEGLRDESTIERLKEIGTSIVDRLGNESEIIIYDDFSNMIQN